MKKCDACETEAANEAYTVKALNDYNRTINVGDFCSAKCVWDHGYCDAAGALSDAPAVERARIVEWLRAMPSVHRDRKEYADWIEEGNHWNGVEGGCMSKIVGKIACRVNGKYRTLEDATKIAKTKDWWRDDLIQRFAGRFYVWRIPGWRIPG